MNLISKNTDKKIFINCYIMHVIKVRWVIKKENKIFLVKITKWNFYCLPGWTYEWNETFQECLKREIIEELWIIPVVGKTILIKEFFKESTKELYLDIWFEITNADDFETVSQEATHAFEIENAWFYSEEDLKLLNVKPGNIFEIILWENTIEFITL